MTPEEIQERIDRAYAMLGCAARLGDAAHALRGDTVFHSATLAESGRCRCVGCVAMGHAYDAWVAAHQLCRHWEGYRSLSMRGVAVEGPDTPTKREGEGV